MERSLWFWVGILGRVLAGWLLVIYFLLLPCSSVAQVATKANEEYRTRAQREKAASEMAPPDRAAVEKTSEMVKSLGLHAGDAVADVGTGVGHLLPFLESEIGTTGTIFAVDIFPEFIAKARERITAAGWRNVHTVLGTERNPKLPANRIDAAILLDTYHHLNYPVATMRGVHRALKSGGRLFVIDYYRSRPHPAASAEQLRRHIRLDRDDVVKEVEAKGFHLSKTFDHMPFMYVLVFEKR